MAFTIIHLRMIRRWGQALFMFTSAASRQVLSNLYKLSIGILRPDLVPHLEQVYTMSFPSSHGMLSAVTYLTVRA